jgi:hypothetical protein
MFAWLFTTVVNALRGTARIFNLELRIVLTEHKIKTEFVKPKNSDVAWDSEHWVYGNIFVEGIANPVKITKSKLEEEDVEIITSDRYKTFMEQSLIEDMLQASKSSGLSLKQVAIALGALNILAVGIVFIITGGI